jgi:hypothetical protein
MPLHDWNDRSGWEGMLHLWITELLRWVKPRLPEGYRAYIGSAPLLAAGAPTKRPDVAVRAWPSDVGTSPAPRECEENEISSLTKRSPWRPLSRIRQSSSNGKGA